MTTDIDKTKSQAQIEFAQNIRGIEEWLATFPDAKYGDDVSPLRHFFGDNIYIREITMPAGLLVTSETHNTTHPFFVLTGAITVQTLDGPVFIRAPYWGMTDAGTKRLIFVHETCVWVTVHATQETDVQKIREEITQNDTKALQESCDKKGVVPCLSEQ